MVEVGFKFFKGAETLRMYTVDSDGRKYHLKDYNCIVTPGDVGRAVKDYMMEIEKDA